MSLPPNIKRASFLSVAVSILKYRSESLDLNCFIGRFHVSVTKVTDIFESKPYHVILEYQKSEFNR